MTTLLEPATEPEHDQGSEPERRGWRQVPTKWWLGAIAVLWVVAAIIWQGKDTLAIGGADQTGVQDWLGDRANDIALAQDNWFINACHWVAKLFDHAITWMQLLISTPDFPSPYPRIGFLGVVAAVWLVTALFAGWRMSFLAVGSLVLFALLGYYQESLDTLIVTLAAVLLSAVVGLPVAVLMAHSPRWRAVVTPLLDLMQTLPSFTYLLPLMLLFGVGAPAALICTVIYSLPPLIRISSHGLQNLPAATMEATTSMGQTRWQSLFKVELPMAKNTIIVGLNQTTMAALSMATIAAFINGPGLGQPVVRALNALRVGDAFVPGLCIVLMAIMLDRITTAASKNSERLRRDENSAMAGDRNAKLLGAAVVAVVLVYLSRVFTWAAEAPGGKLGDWIATGVQHVIDWISEHLTTTTTAISDWFGNSVLNPLEHLIAGSPWMVTGLAILAIAAVVGGWKAALAALICLAGIRGLGLWNNSMITLTSTLVATLVVMLLASVVGVYMGRSARGDAWIRPFLDAGQTMPPFVYLIPVLALFGPTRFTAIVAAVCYAAPAAIKIVADGIRAVSATTVEAAQSAGAVAIQIITKVQIPMARSAFTVAANQGLLYVLSMVVIGGLVGAGALGYDVVAGFKQLDTRGRGLAAGFSIVLLGIMLDRITTYAARRSEAGAR